jgi:hypothetical protein
MAEDYKKGLRRKLKFEKGKEAKDEYGDTKMKPEVKDKEGNIIKKSEPYVYKEDVFETKTEQNLTAEEKDEIEAINLKLSKPLVRALIRLIYVAKPDSYRFEHIQTTLSILKGYTGKYNSFGPVTTDPYDYPWENTMKRRLPWRSEEMFNAYVEREGFFPHVSKRKGLDQAEDIVFFPYKAYLRNTWRVFYEAFFHPFSHPEAVGDVCTLNLEELASLWHLPGAVAQTPTLPRIDSVKGSAPVNLPM